jgi:hypothetical protein
MEDWHLSSPYCWFFEQPASGLSLIDRELKREKKGFSVDCLTPAWRVAYYLSALWLNDCVVVTLSRV